MSVITNHQQARIAIAATVLAFAARASAVECNALPSPIYGTGGSAMKPILGKVGAALSAATPPQTIVYQAPGACFGINSVAANTKLTGTASYWDATGKENTCDLPTLGEPVQFGNMGNSATLCPGVTELPADVGDYLGPVNAYSLIVPNASSQLSISANGAYFAFGFGAAGNVAPWVDETQLIRRDSNSAAQLFISLATGVPAEKFKGVDAKTNGNTVTLVSASPKPEAAIGFVSAEVADAARDRVRALAFQAKGQSCGYWPDSTPTSFDKRNVRTGQYWIWSPMHFFTKLNGDKTPVYPQAKKLIEYFTGESPPPSGVNMLEITVKSGAVPLCAMEVTRKGDLGPLESYAPAEPCGCYFDKTATGTTTCQACANDAGCPSGAPHCRFGFCEVN